MEHLGSYIKYVHMKDSVMVDGQVEYRMMGQGDMPLTEMLDRLTAMGYDGYISLEWVKRWMAELSDAGIVFPQFANFMHDYTPTVPQAEEVTVLQDNHAHTGKYVWPKETLIDETFPDVLDRMVKEFPDQYAFRYTELDYTRTYAQFRDDVDQFARALIYMGVKKGDHVAIWATNVPQWYITFWATTKIGAVLVTVNTAYKIHEAEYLLRQSDTHTLVMIDGYKDSDYVGIMKELCPELQDSLPGKLHSKRLPVLRNIITVDSKQPGCYTWDHAMGLGDSVPPHRGGEAPPPDPPGRRVQHAVHLRHHRLPQGGHAHPLQRGEQRQGHRRLHGPFHRGQADDPGAHVPLLRHGAGHDRRYDPRHHHVPHHRLLPQKGPGLHQ